MHSTFQSTLPVWGGTPFSLVTVSKIFYFNPPSPCGEGLARLALLWRRMANFNPPSPCGEGRHFQSQGIRVGKFQSTLPVWGGTSDKISKIRSGFEFQSTLPVWGGTRPDAACSCKQFQFQSTLPVWGGTGLFVALALVFVISIHPPRVGRDRCFWQLQLRRGVISIHPPRVGRDRASKSRLLWALAHFNPPSPCGEGPDVPVFVQVDPPFQSTLPVWGGTQRRHRLHEGHVYFNPPSPCGEGRVPPTL